MNFCTSLFLELISNLSNNHTDNYDFYRFGKQTAQICQRFPKSIIKQYLYNRGYRHISGVTQELEKSIRLIEPNINRFERLYNVLADEYSKNLLVKIMAYRCLGHKRVKLPLSNPDHWKQIDYIESLKDSSDYIDVPYPGNKKRLYKFNLRDKIATLELYFSASGVYNEFVLKQYEYHKSGKTIKTDIGDIVIDAGACWGDTALKFANEIGDSGRVYSFEFVPSNCSVFTKNMNLNPNLKNRIHLVKKPLSDISKVNYYYKDRGPGTKISSEKFNDYDAKCTSTTIDDFLKDNNIERLNFVKMDVEGAELLALKGAIESIKKYKPVLAISIYHSIDDFVDIPEYVNSLNLGYRLYIGHYTIHSEETVLYGVVDG